MANKTYTKTGYKAVMCYGGEEITRCIYTDDLDDMVFKLDGFWTRFHSIDALEYIFDDGVRVYAIGNVPANLLRKFGDNAEAIIKMCSDIYFRERRSDDYRSKNDLHRAAVHYAEAIGMRKALHQFGITNNDIETVIDENIRRDRF